MNPKKNHVLVPEQLIDIIFRYRQVEIPPVMAKTHILDVMHILPRPILGGHLAIIWILITDVVAGVVPDHVNHFLLVFGDRAANMNRSVNGVREHFTRLMASYEYGNLFHFRPTDY